jgi:hypothetical protein
MSQSEKFRIYESITEAELSLMSYIVQGLPLKLDNSAGQEILHLLLNSKIHKTHDLFICIPQLHIHVFYL